MSLTSEWMHRIERWESTLWNNLFRPLGSIEWNGFTTFNRLNPNHAIKGIFLPMPKGYEWGAKWEYGWFKSSIQLPSNVQGKRIVARINTGGESLVWINQHLASSVNGSMMGSIGWAHKDVTLTTNARGGETYDFLVESYAGHGVQNVGEGPVHFGTTIVPEPPQNQVSVGESTFGIWLEDMYQLALDLTTLLQLRNCLDPLSLRVSRIDEGLMDATRIMDFELPENEMLATMREARARLKPLLDQHNSPTIPTLHSFGHAHIDVAWLWPIEESRRKIARTLVNQLALMEEYPHFRFLQSTPQLYQYLKEDYPELYEAVKKAIKEGKIIPDGSMWVEADTNLSGGEALIRQVIYGQKFFQDEFGFDSRILWLPDVFGYSGALPQILSKCGVKGFATQKITWNYGGGDPFPYNTFWWEGIDGTTIPAHIFTDYTSQTNPKAVMERWNTRLQKNGIDSMILAFGWGDGGGGPTRDHLEFFSRCTDLEGLPRLQMSSPAEFFQDLLDRDIIQNRYVGELYFQAHRGTYTSQARTKQGNRRSEFALREAEFWGSAAHVLKKFIFSPSTLKNEWQQLMVNQFHDILPGSSIHRVYEEAEAGFEKIIESAGAFAHTAAAQFIQKPGGYTVFNSLPWSRNVLVNLPEEDFEVTVPACGWTTIEPGNHPQKVGFIIASPNSLENDWIKAAFNDRGELISLIDKSSGQEFMAEPGNKFHLYKDIPDMWDAWDINSMTEYLPVITEEPVNIEVLKDGPQVASLNITRRLNQSTLSQEIRLRRDSHRLDFITTIDWQESHKLLKVSFPTNIQTNEAVHEIQFGNVRRPNHRSRPYDFDRFEVCNHKWSALVEENRGIAILNDSKYGLSVQNNSINLTLLKSALAPDPVADRGIQTFTYSIYPWMGSLGESEVVQEAYDLNVPVMVLPGNAGQGTIFQLSEANIVLETVKLAEDGSEDIIVRLYESGRMTTHAKLQTILPFRNVMETDMREQKLSPVPVNEGSILLSFRPFEIKTIRLQV